MASTTGPPFRSGLLYWGRIHHRPLSLACTVLDAPSALLAGVDLVLLVPGLGDEREGELVDAIEGDPATAAVPVLGLSAVLKVDPDEREGSVPWPWTVEALVGAIERAVLVPALGGEAL